MNKIILFIGLMAFTSTANAQQPIEYTNTDFGFSLQYPPAYKEMDPHGEAVVLSSIADEWTSKTTFDVQVYHGDSGLVSFCQAYEKQWQENEAFKDLKIISKQDTMFRGFPCRIYTCTADVPQIQKTVEWRAMFVLKKNWIYKLTLSGYPSGFAATMDSTRVIFDSFRFK